MEAVSERQEREAQGLRGLGGKYLTFNLGKEEYGVSILKVREIIGLMEITAVPHTPFFIRGVINLRGRVIPVLELRLKFDMEPQQFDERTCIIVVEMQGLKETVQVGMLVDSVSEVLNIAEDEIEPPPSFGASKIDTGYLLGMGKIKGQVKILLDVDKVISEGELQQLSGM